MSGCADTIRAHRDLWAGRSDEQQLVNRDALWKLMTRADKAEAEIQRLRDAHNAKSGALQTIYRLATSSTGVRGSVMQQIADAAYSALAAVRVEDA